MISLIAKNAKSKWAQLAMETHLLFQQILKHFSLIKIKMKNLKSSNQ